VKFVVDHGSFYLFLSVTQRPHAFSMDYVVIKNMKGQQKRTLR